MESNNPNIEPFYTICNPKGFEGLLFSRPSSDYLLIEQAVRSYNPPFVLQNPAEAVANCIALNSPDWSAAKKNLPASASPQATRGLLYTIFKMVIRSSLYTPVVTPS